MLLLYDLVFCRKRSGFIKRGMTQSNLPNNLLNNKLQKMLQYRAKSSLHFFGPLKESLNDNKLESSDQSCNNESSFENDNFILDDTLDSSKSQSIALDDTLDTLKSQSIDNIVHETFTLSSSDERCSFSDYIAARCANQQPISELIMQLFDNDDIEGIIPPRFLENEPDAMMENIRNEEKIPSSSSKWSSLDGEVFVPSYNVHLVRLLRARMRLSTATVARYSYQSKLFSLDINESLSSVASQLKFYGYESPCISPVSDSEYNNQPSLVSSNAMAS